VTTREAWVEIAVEIPAASEELVETLLGTRFGVSPAIYHNLKTGRSRVSIYLANPRPGKGMFGTKVMSRLRLELRRWVGEGAITGPLRMRVAGVRKENWAESWKKHFKPFVAGGKLLVRPSWSIRRPRVGQVGVVLDPGLSFGTGQHATTRYCLEQIVSLRRPLAKQSFLDLGTGTGILAIAAAKLGYGPVEAMDFDPACVENAKANARRNRVEARVAVSWGDVQRLPLRPSRRFEVVCANLIDDLLVTQARRLAVRVAPGGDLVVAGILRRQFAAVRQALESYGLVFKHEKSEGEWTSGRFAALPLTR